MSRQPKTGAERAREYRARKKLDDYNRAAHLIEHTEKEGIISNAQA